MPAMLKVIRKGAGIELRRCESDTDIELDGRCVGSIIRGGDVRTPVDAGRHTIQIRTGRYSSRLDSFEVADGETVRFRTHGAMGWPRYVASLIKTDLAISRSRDLAQTGVIGASTPAISVAVGSARPPDVSFRLAEGLSSDARNDEPASGEEEDATRASVATSIAAQGGT
jgi:hypothetical protein